MSEFRSSRKNLPIVLVELPVCPTCGARSILANGTKRNGDGSLTKYMRCKPASHRFLLIVEYQQPILNANPESGLAPKRPA